MMDMATADVSTATALQAMGVFHRGVGLDLMTGMIRLAGINRELVLIQTVAQHHVE